MSLQSSFEKLAEITEKRTVAHFGFIKQVLLMSSGLLGVLVSLHKVVAVNSYAHILFGSAIAGLALGILLLTIALSSEVTMNKRMLIAWKSEVMKQLKDPDYRTMPVMENPPKYFEYVEKSGYVILMVALVFITAYAVVIA